MSPSVRVGEIPTLVSNLVDQLTQRLTADDAPERLVVGLVGAPGSGKSTIAEQLKTDLKAAGVFAGLVAMDGFHLSNAVLDELGRRNRKGAPDTFDVEGYLATLDRVRPTAPHKSSPRPTGVICTSPWRPGASSAAPASS